MAGKVRKLTVSEGITLGGAPTPDLIPAEDVSFDPTGTQFSSVQLQQLGEEMDDVFDLKADLVGGFVPAAQLPSYVDDVVEAADFASLPVTGEQGKIYVTLDTNLTYRWTGSIYVQLGGTSGGSSGTGLNYIANPDAENDSAGWATYDDGAVSEPVDGDGGSSVNLTFTRQNTHVIRGDFSFQLAKGAADAQGEGIATPFLIDNADRNKLLQLVLDYNTDGSYDDGDVEFFIYDIDNATLITPNDNTLVGKDKDDPASGSRVIAWSSTDSLNYRLIFHVTTTNASAWDFYYDNVVIGPGSVVTGAVITSWENYTPSQTAGFGTITSRLQWRRVGESIEIEGDFNAGTTTNVEGQIELPNNYTIDYKDSTGTVSVGRLLRAQSSERNVYQLLATSGDTYVNLSDRQTNGATDALIIATNIGDLVATSQRCSIRLTVPILEFAGSGTVNLLSDNVVSANARSKWQITSTSYTSGNVVDFDTAHSEFTNVGSWANTNGSITIPADGDYQITCAVGATSDWDSDDQLLLKIGGVQKAPLDRVAIGVGKTVLGGTAMLKLAKGDILTITAVGTETLSSDNNITQLDIVRIADFSAGQAIGFGEATANQLGLVKSDKYAEHVLNTPVTGTVADIADLKFNNLTIGSRYRLSLNTRFTITGGSITESMELFAKHDGATIITVASRLDSTGSDIRSQTPSKSKIFVATATTLIFETSFVGTGSLDIGSSHTFATLEELPSHVLTTDWD